MTRWWHLTWVESDLLLFLVKQFEFLPGFRQHHLTKTALTKVFNDIRLLFLLHLGALDLNSLAGPDRILNIECLLRKIPQRKQDTECKQVSDRPRNISTWESFQFVTRVYDRWSLWSCRGTLSSGPSIVSTADSAIPTAPTTPSCSPACSSGAS